MTTARFDVIGLGNAIVDVIARADDGFLAQHGIAKGGMTLIDAHRAKVLEDALADTTIVPGGSAANTIAGIASLGGEGAFIGRVHADWLGEGFAAGTQQIGVHFDTPAATEGAPTARSVILVTPDGQRSMNTYLGASVELDEGDIDAATIGAAKILYVEGYLWDAPAAKQAVLKAFEAAHAQGRQVSITLSDSFCVHRYRDEFRDLVRNRIDILFGNEAEIKALYQVESFDEAMAAVRREARIAVLTRSEKGSVVIKGSETWAVPASPAARIVDTTGAGDLYAAGFLFGFTHGKPLAECARLGGVAAAEIISHVGARPEQALRELI